MLSSLGPLLLAFNLFGASAMAFAPRRLNESPMVVDLGTADDFAILSKSGVSTTGLTMVTGNVGTSPIAATAMTGFSLILDSSTTFSTSSDLVTGKLYAASYTSPTPTKMTTAVSDMETAYTAAAGRVTPDEIELGAENIENHILSPGLYKWASSVDFTSSVTFNGTNASGEPDADAVWILQISGDLTAGSGAIVTLVGGAKAENIFWQVAGATTLRTTSEMQGVILCATGIEFDTGSSLVGAALSQMAVTLDAATITKPTRTA